MDCAQETGDRIRLISSILRFMNDELAREDVTPDKSESLEVAVQCLKLAYDIPDESGTEEPSLLEIYTKAVPKVVTTPPPISDEDRKRAEELKKEGNEFMKKEAYQQAVQKYTEAITIDPRSAVYYCNRAAAHTGKGDNEAALSDCKKAVENDRNYSKAYSRMGLTYSKMEKYVQALECYEKALQLDPENEGYQNNMKIAKEKVQEQQANPMPFPGFGGSGGLADMLNNPMVMNMAQQVMSDPAMQQMAMNMMGSFMGGAPPGAPGAPGAPGGSGPDMSQMLRMGQQFAAQVSEQNPELVDSLRNEMGKNNQNDKGDAK